AAFRSSNTVLRRLTRTEYVNSVRDLFGVEFPYTAELPADSQSAGFDNMGDSLALSAVLLEDYLKVARKFSNLLLGTGGLAWAAEQFPATGSQAEWLEGFPLGIRGGVRVNYYFPRSGEYQLGTVLDNQVVRGGVGRVPLTQTEGVRYFKLRR